MQVFIVLFEARKTYKTHKMYLHLLALKTWIDYTVASSRRNYWHILDAGQKADTHLSVVRLSFARKLFPRELKSRRRG